MSHGPRDTHTRLQPGPTFFLPERSSFLPHLSLCLHLGAIADFLRLTLFAGSGDFADPWLGVSGSLALRLVCHRLGCVPSIRVQRTGGGHSPIVTELRRYFAVG